MACSMFVWLSFSQKLDVLIQSAEGLLLPGGTGDRIVNNYSIYSAFTSPQEYQLHANGRNIASLPVDYPITPGMLLIFGVRPKERTQWRFTFKRPNWAREI